MRGTVETLQNPDPLIRSLPALYQGDGFLDRFLSVLDTQLAPIQSAIENQSAYLDPATTPRDFLPWLAGWVGLTLDENWSEPQQRRLIAHAVHLLRLRGTVEGLEQLLVAFLGIDPEAISVDDSGGVTWSAAPGTRPPGSRRPRVQVVVQGRRQAVDEDRLRAFVREAVPAHVLVEVEVDAS